MTILLGNLLFCSYVLHPSPAGQVVTLSITSADLPRCRLLSNRHIKCVQAGCSFHIRCGMRTIAGEATFMIKAPYRAHLPWREIRYIHQVIIETIPFNECLRTGKDNEMRWFRNWNASTRTIGEFRWLVLCTCFCNGKIFRYDVYHKTL